MEIVGLPKVLRQVESHGIGKVAHQVRVHRYQVLVLLEQVEAGITYVQGITVQAVGVQQEQ
ncbi:hypothetical protein TAMYLO_390002 [Tenacibaculum amylolyticum]